MRINIIFSYYKALKHVFSMFLTLDQEKNLMFPFMFLYLYGLFFTKKCAFREVTTNNNKGRNAERKSKKRKIK